MGRNRHDIYAHVTNPVEIFCCVCLCIYGLESLEDIKNLSNKLWKFISLSLHSRYFRISHVKLAWVGCVRCQRDSWLSLTYIFYCCFLPFALSVALFLWVGIGQRLKSVASDSVGFATIFWLEERSTPMHKMIQNAGMGWDCIIVCFFILAAVIVKIKGPSRKRKKKVIPGIFSLYTVILVCNNIIHYQ